MQKKNKDLKQLSLQELTEIKTGKKQDMKRKKGPSPTKEENHLEKKTKKGKSNNPELVDHCLNKLVLYPKPLLPNHIVSFVQLLYKNLHLKPKEPKTLESCFMTSFGFETRLLLPILSHSNIKVSL